MCYLRAENHIGRGSEGHCTPDVRIYIYNVGSLRWLLRLLQQLAAVISDDNCPENLAAPFCRLAVWYDFASLPLQRQLPEVQGSLE